MMKIMGKVKEAQDRLKKAKENLGVLTLSSESGGGMVKVTVNGNRQILKIEVENSLIKPEDKEMLQDLIVAATNKALQEIEIKIQEELKKSTEGLLPNIPGFDLGNLGGMM